MRFECRIDDAAVTEAFARSPRIMRYHLNKALDKAATELTRAVRDKLRDNGSMGHSHLMNSIRPERPFPLARDVKAGMKYARAVEEGTKPGYRGMPPREPLAAWLRVRHGLSKKESDRRSYGLARYLQAHGTKPAPFFKPAFEQNQSRLMQMLRDGVGKGLAASIKKQGSSV